MQRKSISFIFISLFLFSVTISGQLQTNSPYARFNLGNIESSGSFRSLGMGGISVGMKSGNSVFFSNPASYSSIDTNSFSFDFGMDFGMVKLLDKNGEFNSHDFNFDHLIMAFPLSRGFGFAVGVVPVSDGYYNLSESVLKGSPYYDPIIGEYASAHNGTGGLNSLFLGTGIKIIRNLSLGINMTMLYGSVNRSNQIIFVDYVNAYNNNTTERLEMHGLNFDYGLQYNIPLKNDYYINAGISFNQGKNYKSNYQELSYKYTNYNTRDTISYAASDSAKTFIPGTFGLGFTFGKTNKLTAGFDFIFTKWSSSKIPGSTGYAADSKYYRLGIEYIPDKYSNYSLLKRIEYRIGGHIGNTYLIINNQQINEYGASLGFGFPMRRSLSKTNFYIDYTRKSGSGSTIAHQEDIVTVGISLNLYDFWFLKRRYD